MLKRKMLDTLAAEMLEKTRVEQLYLLPFVRA